MRDVLQTFCNFLTVQSHRLLRRPDWLFPLAHSQPRGTPVEVRAEDDLRAGGGPATPWLRRICQRSESLEAQRLMAKEHADAVFAGRGRWIVSSLAGALGRSEAIVWDSATGRALQTLTGIQAPLASAHRKSLIACADLAKSVCLLDLESGQIMRQFGPEAASVMALNFSPDDRFLACVTRPRDGLLWKESGSGRLLLWDIENKRQVWSLPGRSKSRYGCLSFSPDGRFLATSRGRSVIIVDTRSPEECKVLAGHSKSVAAASFSLDGRFLATGSSGFAGADGEVLLWDWHSGRPLNGPERMRHCSVCALGFSPDGQRLAVARQDGRLDLFATETWELEASTVNSEWALHSLCFSPDGRMLVAASRNAGILLWRLPDALRPVAESWAHSDRVRDAAFPSARGIMASVSYYELITSDARSGRLLQRVSFPDRARSVVTLACAADGKTAACGDLFGGIWLVDLAHGAVLSYLPEKTGKSRTLSFSPDGSRLAGVSQEDGLLIVLVKDGRSAVEWRRPDLAGSSLAWSPDGGRILVGDRTGTARLVDFRSGTADIVGPRLRAPLVTVSWSRYGRLVALAGWDGELDVLDEPSFSLRTKLLGEKGSHTPQFAFSPDEEYIAWTAAEQLVQVRSIDGAESGEMEVMSPILALSWDVSPHGLLVADSGSNSGLRPISYLLEVHQPRRRH